MTICVTSLTLNARKDIGGLISYLKEQLSFGYTAIVYAAGKFFKRVKKGVAHSLNPRYAI